MVDTLDKATLVDLVNGLIDSYPSLQPEIEKHIPPPTLQSVCQVINDLENKLSESFPYNRSGPLRDDYSFNRVKGHIMDLVVSFNFNFLNDILVTTSLTLRLERFTGIR
jgi:hypothetical protein